MTTTLTLDASRRYCRDLTKKSATSFYYAFKTLPRKKRLAFEVVYAFMRLSDDISDDAAAGGDHEDVRRWREILRVSLAGDTQVHPVMPALVDVMQRFSIPASWMEELIDGVEQDLTIKRFETMDDLRSYCHKVAGVVGLVSLRIFGIQNATPERWRKAEKLAEACGQAFQLTNILRDVKEDMGLDRIYLPAEVLRKFEVTEAMLKEGRMTPAFHALMAHMADLAEADYATSKPLLSMIERDARPCLQTMRGIYHRILEGVVDADYDVFSRRVRVPLGQKLGIAARAFLGRWTP
ncbi:MAG TPA: phytoene/squalene synthase family protein [Planctomycetes bacterium]|nr:phytoene/squalene synthase family protein [Planctomycetota bacterium]